MGFVPGVIDMTPLETALLLVVFGWLKLDNKEIKADIKMLIRHQAQCEMDTKRRERCLNQSQQL